MATSGPGAINLVTGLANAMMDSAPVVAITANVATASIGSDAFQEADITGITIPVTKHNFLVRDLQQLPGTIKEAFHLARIAREEGIEEAMFAALRRARVCSIGPTTTEALEEFGVHPAMEPSHPKMGILVREALA